MPSRRLPIMSDVNTRYVAGLESNSALQIVHDDLWPLVDIDPKKEKFPCCVVWTPLPVVSWIAPFLGHVGICREDGTILDFNGSGLITVGHLKYGAVARYYQIDRQQCCFPPVLAGHTCKHSHQHAEFGAAISWDDAVLSTTRHFENRTFDPFTCNGHVFVANCLNRLAYGGSMNWNMIKVGALILSKGRWVDGWAILRSFLPFLLVIGFGVLMLGWQFLVGISFIMLLVAAWHILAYFLVKDC